MKVQDAGSDLGGRRHLRRCMKGRRGWMASSGKPAAASASRTCRMPGLWRTRAPEWSHITRCAPAMKPGSREDSCGRDLNPFSRPRMAGPPWSILNQHFSAAAELGLHTELLESRLRAVTNCNCSCCEARGTGLSGLR